MAVLGQHRRLAVPEVAWYYPRFRAFLHTYGDLAELARFRMLVAEMIFGLKTLFFGLDLNPATIVDELVRRTRANTFREAYAAFLGLYAEAVGKPRWGEKTPHNQEFYSDWGDPQTEDPHGTNYVTAAFLPRPCISGESETTVYFPVALRASPC
jgi:hypothetical protein